MATATNADIDTRVVPLRVLVVSDQELWLRSLDCVLGARGYQVAGASCGADAVRETLRERPDLLVIHANLADTSGIALCRELRERGLIDAGSPVLLLCSGPFTREDRMEALRAGVWDCYASPPDVELLLLKLEVYARARRALERTV